MEKSGIERSAQQIDSLAPLAAWGLVALVSIVGIVAWSAFYQWHLWPLNAYQVFPVLGLLAFGIMWAQYMVTAIITYFNLQIKALGSYFKVTGYIVLVLICLHPGLLIYQRFKDGFGLPPHSYISYVAPGLGWVTLLGTASWLIFMAFELHRFFGDRSWWHYVVDAGDVAMLAIVYHALRLGSTLLQPWYRTIWYIYLISLILALIYKYRLRFASSKQHA